MNALVRISRELSAQVETLRFPSVPSVYNPLVYARGPHEAYLERWGSKTPRELLLVGMNPGPFGMSQTGVPFGDVVMVRDFVGVSGDVGKPPREHPRRPIDGFACARRETSGQRLWGWARDRCETPERFFDRVFVANWCPLVFVEESGRNRTPEKLPTDEQAELFRICDHALAQIVAVLRPALVVGVGRLPEQRARAVLPDVDVGYLLHPSGANPAANNWAERADTQLKALGFELCAAGLVPQAA